MTAVWPHYRNRGLGRWLKAAMLQRLQQAVMDDGNVFEVLMDAVRCCSLGEITDTLFEVGGRYRRNV